MKRLSLTSAFVLLFLLAYGQKKQYIYCELVGVAKFLSPKVIVNMDFGQNQRFFSTNKTIRDENGKIRVFNSMVDALNYMGSQGWEFVQAYTVTVGEQNVYHWLLKKEADADDLEYLKTITTKTNTAANSIEDKPKEDKPKAPNATENVSFSIDKKGNQVNINCTFNPQKRCTVKSKIRVWFDEEDNTSINNNTDKNCNGNFSFTLEGKNLETAKQKGIKVLQIPTNEGVFNLLIDTTKFLSEINQ